MLAGAVAKSAVACSLVTTKRRWAASTAHTGACFKYKLNQVLWSRERHSSNMEDTWHRELPLGFSMTLCGYFGCACPVCGWTTSAGWQDTEYNSEEGGLELSRGEIPILPAPWLRRWEDILLSCVHLVFKCNGSSSYICKGTLLEIKNYIKKHK